MSANLPSPLSQAQSAGLAANLKRIVGELFFATVQAGTDLEVAKRKLSFTLAHLAAEYGLDPTGKR